MVKNYSDADRDFFIVALKEEARDVLWKVGSSTEPKTLIEGIIDELEALAPKADGVEDRSEEQIWQQVREKILKAAYATRPHCIRCGTCCTKGSPTLIREDRELFTSDLLKPEHVVTIREGEAAYDSRTEQTGPAEREMIKIREVPGTRRCIFYHVSDKSCSIYESRPQQCRRQECWNSEPPEERDDVPLTRRDLLQVVGSLWDVIQRHEERCSHSELNRMMTRLAATKGQTVDEVIELLGYDEHVREFISERLGLALETMDFFFGRPLREVIEMFGLKAEDQPDGSVLLTVIDT